MCIKKLPDVLAIQLKRFDYDWERYDISALFLTFSNLRDGQFIKSEQSQIDHRMSYHCSSCVTA